MFEHDEITIDSHGRMYLKGVVNEQYIDKIRQDIMDAEDQEIFKILDSIAASGNNDI